MLEEAQAFLKTYESHPWLELKKIPVYDNVKASHFDKKVKSRL